MVRLSFLEQHTLQPGGQGKAKPMCLRNGDYAKMRRKLEVAFPDPVDAAKVGIERSIPVRGSCGPRVGMRVMDEAVTRNPR